MEGVRTGRLVFVVSWTLTCVTALTGPAARRLRHTTASSAVTTADKVERELEGSYELVSGVDKVGKEV